MNWFGFYGYYFYNSNYVSYVPNNINCWNNELPRPVAGKRRARKRRSRKNHIRNSNNQDTQEVAKKIGAETKIQNNFKGSGCVDVNKGSATDNVSDLKRLTTIKDEKKKPGKLVKKLNPAVLLKNAAVITSKDMKKAEIVKKGVQATETLGQPEQQSATILSLQKNSKKSNMPNKDIGSSDFVTSLACAFNLEIEAMQKHLLAGHSENDFIVAKMYQENNSKISDHLLEFIRSELIGWIGVYQEKDIKTLPNKKNKRNLCENCPKHKRQTKNWESCTSFLLRIYSRLQFCQQMHFL